MTQCRQHTIITTNQRDHFFFFFKSWPKLSVFITTPEHTTSNDMDHSTSTSVKQAIPAARQSPPFPESASGCRMISTLIILHALPFFINPCCKQWPLQWISGELRASLKFATKPDICWCSYCMLQAQCTKHIPPVIWVIFHFPSTVPCNMNKF